MLLFVPLAARLVLAGVFGLAGFAKFSNIRIAAESLAPFGVPPQNSHVAAKLLATAEVVFAVAAVLESGLRLLPADAAAIEGMGTALNREQAFRAITVLDEGFVLGKSLGAQGTPSGVIVEHGRVVSEVGVGARDVFSLVSSGAFATQG